MRRGRQEKGRREKEMRTQGESRGEEGRRMAAREWKRILKGRGVREIMKRVKRDNY